MEVIAGYTLTENSLIGFKIEYTFNYEYDNNHPSFNIPKTSHITINLLLPGCTTIITEKFRKEQDKENIEAEYTKKLTKLLITTYQKEKLH